MSIALSHHLSQDQIDQFLEEGYLLVEDLIEASMLDAVAGEVNAVIDREAEALVEKGELSRTYAELPFTTRLTAISAETTAVFDRILSGQLSLPAMFELIRYEPLLDVAESLCGPEIIASSVYRLRPKIPNLGRGVVPWHQDSGYFEPFCDSGLVLTCWIPLVDANAENGCLQVIRKAHKGPVVQHEQRPWYLEIIEENLPAGEIVTVPVRRGSVLLMTNRTPHQSTPNLSDTIRWSMDLRYQSASLPTNAPITRLPGEEMLEDAPLACYLPEADFLVRSESRPEQVLRTAEEFNQLRRTHKPGPAPKRWGRE